MSLLRGLGMLSAALCVAGAAQAADPGDAQGMVDNIREADLVF